MKINRNKKRVISKRNLLKLFPIIEELFQGLDKILGKNEKFNINKLKLKIKRNKKNKVIGFISTIYYKGFKVDINTSLKSSQGGIYWENEKKFK